MCFNGSEFKNEVTKLLEKHGIKIRRETTKYKHTHTAFVKFFNEELSKLLFKPMDTQELQDPKKSFDNLGQKFEQDREQNEQYSIINDWYEA